MKKRVLLDADGVLINFHEPCLALINELAGTNHDLKGLAEWDIFKALNVPKDVVDKVYEIMKSPGWCRELPVYPEAKEGVELLRQVADVYISTSPMNGPTWMHERERALTHHFGFTSKQILHGSAKYLVAGDALVDDKVANLRKWSVGHPGGLAVRWIIPQYRHHEWEGPATDSWARLAEMVERHRTDRQWHHE